MAPEVCDSNTTACTALGYLAGTAACGHLCTFDISTCAACETTSSVLECRQLASSFGMSVTTTTAGPELAISPPNHIALYGRDASGLVSIADVNLDLVEGLLPIPNGWITLQPPGRLSTLDAAGTPGSVISDPTDPGSDVALAYGAGGRVIEAWSTIVQQMFVTKIRIADTSANIVVPAATIAMAAKQMLAATSDGTSFFVMTAGQITQIGSDGTIGATTSGYPLVQLGLPVLFAWGTTGGWFVGAQGTSPPYEAQRFDATGAKVGAPIEISDSVLGFNVDGDDLIATTGSGTPTSLALARITPSGVITRSPQVGVTDGYGNGNEVVRFGPDLLVSWVGASQGQLARVAF